MKDYSNHPFRCSFHKRITKDGKIKSRDYYKGSGLDKVLLHIQKLKNRSNGKNIDMLYSNLVHKFPNLTNLHREYFWKFFCKRYYSSHNYELLNDRTLKFLPRTTGKRYISDKSPDFKIGWYDLNKFTYVKEEEVDEFYKLEASFKSHIVSKKLYDNKFGKRSFDEDLKHYLIYRERGLIYALISNIGYNDKLRLRFQLNIDSYVNENLYNQMLNKYPEGFEEHIIAGNYVNFDKKSSSYKKLKSESDKESAKKCRNKKKIMIEKQYCFLTDSEIKAKFDKEQDIINRDRFGFDANSFRGEYYHGQKRKLKNK